MESRLTQTQLAQVVAEIELISQRRELELTSQQVKEILRELNLPEELLEDAIAQLRRREVLKHQQQRHRLIAIALAAVATVTIGGSILFGQNRQRQTANVQARQDQIALSQTGGDRITQVSRQSNPRVFYRVTLENAPIDRQLSLQCDWIDPSGQTVHQGRYQTRSIDTPIWDTYCFYDIGSNAAVGNWRVQMSIDGRVLSTEPFTVQ